MSQDELTWVSDPPRDLTQAEQALLDFMLSQGFPGCAELRQQAAVVQVAGGCRCGCGSLDLAVPEGAPRARLEGSRIVEAHSFTDDTAIEVLLHVGNGLMAGLEIVDYLPEVGEQRNLPNPSTLEWVGVPEQPTPSEFHQDFDSARNSLRSARHNLLVVIRPLTHIDFARARRGGWTVARVLEHVIDSEWLYGRLVLHLRGQQASGELESGAPSNAADAERRLASSRQALLAAVEGVDEETFYRLQKMGHEEYSVVSILENAAAHDHEHTGQIREILAATG